VVSFKWGKTPEALVAKWGTFLNRAAALLNAACLMSDLADLAIREMMILTQKHIMSNLTSDIAASGSSTGRSLSSSP